MNFSPEMLNSLKNMINPQMVREMGNKVNTMSDDQLRAFLVSMGMGHITPQAYRSMCGLMKNMSDKDIENLKDKADTNKFSKFNSHPPPDNPNNTAQNNNNNNNSNTNTSEKNDKPKASENLDDFLCNDKTKIALKKLENIKNEGNAFFKSSRYQEACEKYYEVLNELDYLGREQDLNDKLKDIESLENTCRLNIATCKLKTNDNDLAINECLKILKKSNSNIKAHYKAGCGYINKKNYEKALYHFEKVREINPHEDIEQVKKYITECKKFVISNEEKNKTHSDKAQNDNLEKKESNFDKITIEEKTEPKPQSQDSDKPNENDLKRSQSHVPTKKDKLKEVLEKEVKPKEKEKENEPEAKKADDQNEIIIEDNSPKQEVKVEQDPNTNKSSGNNSSVNSSTPINNIDSSKINEAREKIKSMDNDKLNSISSMFKNMDNNMIKSIYQMQGMNITDEQINFMKNNMNPDLMKMAADMNPTFPTPNNNNNTQNFSTQNTTNSNTNSGYNLNSENYFPNNPNANNSSSVSNSNPQQNPNNFGNGGFPNMDMNAMMDFIQKNPNIMNMMGPQMSSMFGGGANGMDPNLMMNSMQTILWIMSLPTRIKQFFSSTKGKILILCLLFLIISYFFR